ncbi:unnamed protein product [Ostreobium quekettii]|uniref:thioredoxin-dependent peroxiredoxin n=1 Tax=Ostreobium quekettii TaxID=121088 RepID=A0A8S1JFR1_9CHLO|nr:unnamed protein product [Ostreobium quekettii]
MGAARPITISFLACLPLILASASQSPSGETFWGAPRGPGALVPRRPAPNFTATAVVGEKFETVSVSDYLGKWLVLLFYPFDFTFVCPTELVAFSEASEKFAAVNTKVVAISTDSHHTHLAWVRTPRNQGGLGAVNFPLVADISKRISYNYGVLVEDEDDVLYGAALRGIFLIDPNGTIRSTQVNDESVGRNVDEVVRLVQAFQYADEHGEGCPANWKPGDDTVKPDPDGSKAFFASWSAQHVE